MGVKFLGQFLIDKGLINNEQLLAALKDQDDKRMGRLAVAKGILLQSELEEILQQQRYIDGRVGDLAVRNNMMTPEQQEYLVKLHRNDRRRLGEVLVNRGYVALEDFSRALCEFEAQQANFIIDPQYLPPSHHGRGDMVAMIGMTQKVLLRVAAMPAKIEAAQPYTGSPTPWPLSCEIRLTGDYGGRYVLSMPLEVARPLEARMAAGDSSCGGENGDSRKSPESDLRDALGELCNCIVGAAASALAAMGHVVQLSPPKHLPSAADPGCEPIRDGVRWNVHTPHGTATALMD